MDETKRHFWQYAWHRSTIMACVGPIMMLTSLPFVPGQVTPSGSSFFFLGAIILLASLSCHATILAHAPAYHDWFFGFMLTVPSAILASGEKGPGWILTYVGFNLSLYGAGGMMVRFVQLITEMKRAPRDDLG